MEAAVHLFVTYGFHATSVREVAAEAGVSMAGIYRHFPSRQPLLIELLNVTMTEIRWRLLVAREQGLRPRRGSR